jgi:hypothetical protein
MELTPEERQKIYLEEKARIEVRQELEKIRLEEERQAKKKQEEVSAKRVGAFLLLFVPLILIVVFMHIPPVTGVHGANDPASDINIGNQAHLNKETMGGATNADFNDVEQRLAAKDFVGLAQLVTNGRAASIPSGTSVLVTDVGLEWVRVRCLDGAFKDQEYYVARDAVSAN